MTSFVEGKQRLMWNQKISDSEVDTNFYFILQFHIKFRKNPSRFQALENSNEMKMFSKTIDLTFC